MRGSGRADPFQGAVSSGLRTFPAPPAPPKTTTHTCGALHSAFVFLPVTVLSEIDPPPRTHYAVQIRTKAKGKFWARGPGRILRSVRAGRSPAAEEYPGKTSVRGPRGI